jgi:hypothetical protein
MAPKHPKMKLLRVLQREEGWTFVEAVFSLMLLTVVFLGFTITLLAFREWVDRSWAIRVMDQYANDVMSHLDAKLRLTSNISSNPSQYGMGAFRLDIPNFNFSNTTQIVMPPTSYNYSCRPTLGVYYGEGNVASQKLDPDFPPSSWGNEHKFVITNFSYSLWNNPQLSPTFTQSMVVVKLAITYERPNAGEPTRYKMKKEYTLAQFIKNRVDGP